MKIVFWKTVLFLNVFLFSIGLLSAQENSVPVKIESPTSDFVSRSFTISGSAQAGAKLHLSINGKTFGRYRATIDGKFTIGVSVPEDELLIKIDHLMDGEIQSSDSISLQVNADKAGAILPEPKTETPEKKEAIAEPGELKKKALPTAGRIPSKPLKLKREYSDDLSEEANDPTVLDRDPVVLNRNVGIAEQNQQESDISAGGRIAFEVLGAVAVTGAVLLATIFTAGLQNGGNEELALSLFAAELSLAPLGVYLGGKLAGGVGDLWPVYVGELFGLIGSVGFILLASSAGDGTESVLFLMAFLSPFVGMVAGYEISHAINFNESGSFSMQPTIHLSKDVKGMGLRFSF